ncbi:hypothetical protein JYT26_02595 [Beggiatoa alba]|nr:hypothetical protein [Beggiatoa alba]
MVRITGAYHTAAGENYQAVEIPLTDPDLSMVIIIPTPGQFDNIRQNLDAILWNDIRGKLEASEPAAETTVHIPTFALARELSNDDMPYLGVALIDNAEGSPSSAPDNPDTTANFSRVNNAGFLYLETPQQHIALTVDEQGLNASTVTAAVHMATKDEPSNLFNSAYISSFSFGLTSHNGTGFFLTISGDTQPCFYPPEQNPFLFAIYAAASDTLLYLGQVQALEGPLVTADWTVPNDTWFCGLTPPVEIYKYNGSLQCEPDDGITIWDMKQELSNAGIEVLDYYQGTDGNAYITLCGSPDGIINIFTIPEPQVPLAKELGFSERTELAL